MRDVIAQQVHKIFSKGLELFEIVRRNPNDADFDRENTEFQTLLAGPQELYNDPDWAGDQRTGFLGLRYALTSWVDEVFTLYVHPDWMQKWTERQMEFELFESNVRAVEFWKQLNLAFSQAGAKDLISVFYWCVMLGFRGRYRNEPEELAKKIDNMRQAITQNPGSFPLPPEGDAPIDTEPLVGKKSFQTAIQLWVGLVLLFIPVILFLLARMRVNS